MNIITQFFSKKSKDPQKVRAQIMDDLLHREAKIGGALFGELPKGHSREFFCLDENTWVWYERWKDENGNFQKKTTRYQVRTNGIFKSVNNNHYEHVSARELENFSQAAELYVERVNAELYAVAS